MPEKPYYKGITNFKEILQTKYDKPFESVSESDIRKDMISQGYSRKDVKDVVQGFRKFKKKDADFEFKNGGFRINTREGALEGSGRKKGRSVDESNLSKLLNLGQDVSKFAEFTDVAARKINAPDVIDIPEDTGEIDVDFTDEEVFGGINPFATGPIKRSGSKGKGSRKGKGEVPVTEEIEIETPDFGISDALDLNLPLMEDEEESGEFSKFLTDVKRIATSPNVEDVPISKLQGTVQGYDYLLDKEFGKTTTGSIISELGLSPTGGAKSALKGLRGSFQGAKQRIGKFFSAKAPKRTLAEQRKHIMSKVGKMVKADKTTKENVAKFRATKFKPKTTFKDVLQKSVGAKSNVKNVNVNLQKNLAPVVKKLSGQPIGKISPVSQFADQLRATGRTVGVMKDGTRVRVGAGGSFQVFAKGGKISNGESSLTSKYGNYETLASSIDPKLGNRVWQDQKTDSPLMFSRAYYNGLEGEGYPVSSPRTSDDTSLLSYMKRGGKLPVGKNGIKLRPGFGAYTEAGLHDKFNPFKSRSRSGPDVNRIDLDSNIQPPEFSIDPLTIEVPELTDPIHSRNATHQKEDIDNEEATHLTTGLGENKDGINFNNLLYYGSTLGLPAGAALASHLKSKELEDQLVPKFRSPELNTGVVRDIRRPDFSTPYQPTTADVGAENANRQFQLAQNEQGERAFEAAQDESKIRQEEAIRENQNRQSIIDAETRNKEEQVRSGIATQRYFGALNRRDQALIGGAETLANTAVQREFISSNEKTERFKELVRKGKIDEAMAFYQGRRFGGKLTKFSNGR